MDVTLHNDTLCYYSVWKQVFESSGEQRKLIYHILFVKDDGTFKENSSYVGIETLIVNYFLDLM